MIQHVCMLFERKRIIIQESAFPRIKPYTVPNIPYKKPYRESIVPRILPNDDTNELLQMGIAASVAGWLLIEHFTRPHVGDYVGSVLIAFGGLISAVAIGGAAIRRSDSESSTIVSHTSSVIAEEK